MDGLAKVVSGAGVNYRVAISETRGMLLGILKVSKWLTCLCATTGLDYGLYLSVSLYEIQLLLRCLLDFRDFISSYIRSTHIMHKWLGHACWHH